MFRFCAAPTGLESLLDYYPALTCWAKLFRPFGTGSSQNGHQRNASLTTLDIVQPALARRRTVINAAHHSQCSTSCNRHWLVAERSSTQRITHNARHRATGTGSSQNGHQRSASLTMLDIVRSGTGSSLDGQQRQRITHNARHRATGTGSSLRFRKRQGAGLIVAIVQPWMPR